MSAAGHRRRLEAPAPALRAAGAPKGVAILGSTGSIGTTALRVLARQRERFRVAALTAFNNAALLREQQELFAPGYVGLVSEGATHAGWATWSSRCSSARRG